MKPVEEAAVAFLNDWAESRGLPAGFDAVATVLATFGNELTKWRPEQEGAIRIYVNNNVYPGVATFKGSVEAAVASNIQSVIEENTP